MLVAVVPREADGILAHRLNFRGPRGSLEHRQRPGDRLQGIARLTAILLALFVAQSAGAGIPQERKAIDAVMAVLPLDVHAGAGSDIDFDGFGICNQDHDDWLSRVASLLPSIAETYARKTEFLAEFFCCLLVAQSAANKALNHVQHAHAQKRSCGCGMVMHDQVDKAAEDENRQHNA